MFGGGERLFPGSWGPAATAWSPRFPREETRPEFLRRGGCRVLAKALKARRPGVWKTGRRAAPAGNSLLPGWESPAATTARGGLVAAPVARDRETGEE